jgi:hypothetical protein
LTHQPILLLLDALACFRLTHLVIHDAIFAPVRDLLIGHTLGETRDMAGHRPPVAARPRMAMFLSCPWCVSAWLAVPVVALQALLPGVCLIVAAVLAFSAVAGVLSELG